jgi:predicted carbohydrate-binding protein with CBM5 and CBM33 domain
VKFEGLAFCRAFSFFITWHAWNDETPLTPIDCLEIVEVTPFCKWQLGG